MKRSGRQASAGSDGVSAGGDRRRHLHDLVAANRNGELRSQLANHANPSEVDEQGWTPLHMAAKVNNHEAAIILLKHGVSADARDMERRSPLHVAMQYEASVKLVTLLVQCRAEVNGQDEGGNSPLHLLARNSKNLDLAEHLLANGANPNITNNVKHTPLQYATTPGLDEPFVLILLKHGAMLNTANGKAFMKGYRENPVYREYDMAGQHLLMAFMMGAAQAKQTQRLQVVMQSVYQKVRDLSTLKNRKAIAEPATRERDRDRADAQSTLSGEGAPGDSRLAVVERRLAETHDKLNQVLDRLQEQARAQEKQKFDNNQERWQLRRKLDEQQRKLSEVVEKVNGLAMAYRSGGLGGPNGGDTTIPAHHPGGMTGSIDQQTLVYITDALAKIMAKQNDLEQRVVGGSQLTPSPSAESVLTPTGMEFGTLGEKVDQAVRLIREFRSAHDYSEEVVAKGNFGKLFEQMKRMQAGLQTVSSKQADIEKGMLRMQAMKTGVGQQTPQPGTPQSGIDAFTAALRNQELDVGREFQEIKDQLTLIEERQDYLHQRAMNNDSDDEDMLSGVVQEMFQNIQARLDQMEGAAGTGGMPQMGSGGGEVVALVRDIHSVLNTASGPVDLAKAFRNLESNNGFIEKIMRLQEQQITLHQLAADKMDSLKQDLAAQIARLPVGGNASITARSRAQNEHVAPGELVGDLSDIKVKLDLILRNVGDFSGDHSILTLLSKLDYYQMELLSSFALNPPPFSNTGPEGSAQPESSIAMQKAVVRKMSENLAAQPKSIDDEAHLEEHLLYHTKAIDLLQQQLEAQQSLLTGMNAKLLQMATVGEAMGLGARESGLDPLIAKYQTAAGRGGLDDGRLKAYEWSELKTLTSGFGIEKSINSSDSGTLYLAAQGDNMLAIKSLSLDFAAKSPVDWVAQVQECCHVVHAHVVPCLGYAYNPDRPKERCLVYSYQEQSLESMLKSLEYAPVAWQARVRIVRDVARGLAFVHKRRVGGFAQVHKNLKPSNILLDGDLTAKVADVGQPNLLGDAWVPPATQFQDPDAVKSLRYDPSSDVYALGVVAMMVVAGRTSPRGLIQEFKRFHNSPKEQSRVVDPSAGQWSKAELRELLPLLDKCVAVNRSDRPNLETKLLPLLDGICQRHPPPAMD